MFEKYLLVHARPLAAAFALGRKPSMKKLRNVSNAIFKTRFTATNDVVELCEYKCKQPVRVIITGDIYTSEGTTLAAGDVVEVVAIHTNRIEGFEFHVSKNGQRIPFYLNVHQVDYA